MRPRSTGRSCRDLRTEAGSSCSPPATRGLGVLHKAFVTEFLTDHAETTGTPPSAVDFGSLLQRAEDGRPAQRLLDLRQAGRDIGRGPDKRWKHKGQTLSNGVRDAFVTEDGTQAGKILGYLSDLDIAKKARLGG